MIRVSFMMVKQAQGAQVSARIAPRSATSRLRSSLLPPAQRPTVERASMGGAANLDAVLAILPDTASPSLFAQMPESERWHELNARSKPSAGTVRTTVLANRRQTLAVLGYIGAQASTFERLWLAGKMLKELLARNPRSLGLAAPGTGRAAEASLEALLAASLAHAFRLPSFRARTAEERNIERIVLLGERTGRQSAAAKIDIAYALASARGTNLTRWLTALPPNLLDANGYRSVIQTLTKRSGIGVRWLGEAALRGLGANAFLAVARANQGPGAGIAHLTYRPPRRRIRAPDVALVGKGILFDTGGINLKSHRSMLDMHIDMSGSAVALATLLALAELRAPIAVDAWLAITENRIGPNAYRPQEVVTATNGVTIQVIHSDAEGRMVLADTLALASRTRPRFMIDFATLTGACVYSLTERMSGVLTNRPNLAATLVQAGRSSGERVWAFPLDADYDTDLESKVADILQCSVEGKGDHILATRFLRRFVPDEIAWAHVDLSAAMRPGGLGHINTDITGFGVRFALELILRQEILDAAGPGP
jgi:leucyl aminopeptidase